jgi:hypothetical protein
MAVIDLDRHPEIVAAFTSVPWLLHKDRSGETAPGYIARVWGCKVEKNVPFQPQLHFDSDADAITFMLTRPWETVP